MRTIFFIFMISLFSWQCGKSQEANSESAPSYKDVNKAMWKKIETDHPGATMIVDVRTTGEWQQGHLDGAIHIPMSQFRSRMNEISKDKKILIYCAVGGRSVVAAQFLVQNGYKNVYNLRGGIVRW